MDRMFKSYVTCMASVNGLMTGLLTVCVCSDVCVSCPV